MAIHKPFRTIRSLGLSFVLLTQLACTESWIRKKASSDLGMEDPKDYSAWPSIGEYAPGSIGLLLDPQFRQHVEVCGIVLPESLTKGRRFVPNEIARYTRTNLDAAGESVDIAGGSLLRYVYGRDQRRLMLTSLQGGRVLTFEYMDLPPLIEPTEGFPSWAIQRSCSGYIQGSASADVKVPSAAVRAAVQADANRQSSLVAVFGRFRSPMAQILGTGDWKTLYANLQLWSLYSDNKDLAGVAYYMKEFNGIMIRRTVGMGSSLNAQISASAALPAAEFQLGADYRAETKFSAKDWQTVIISDIDNPEQREQRFGQLPDPTQIANLFRGLKPTPVGVNEPLRRGVEHAHYQELAGVPRGICNGIWNFEGDTTGIYDGKIGVRGLVEERPAADGGKIPYCKIEISGRPNPALFQAGVARAASVQRSLTLSGKVKRTGTVEGQQLELLISQPLFTTDHPIVRIVSGMPLPFASQNSLQNQFVVHWEFQVDFTDGQEPVLRTAGTRASLDSASIECSGVQMGVTSDATANANGVYVVTLNFGSALSHSDYDVSKQDLICSYNSQLTVRLAQDGNRTATVPIAVRLTFPARKESAGTRPPGQ